MTRTRAFVAAGVLVVMAMGTGGRPAAARLAVQVAEVDPAALVAALTSTPVDPGTLPDGFSAATLEPRAGTPTTGTPTAGPSSPVDALTAALDEDLVGAATFSVAAEEGRQPTPVPTPGEVHFAFAVHLLSFVVFEEAAAAEALLRSVLEDREGDGPLAEATEIAGEAAVTIPAGAGGLTEEGALALALVRVENVVVLSLAFLGADAPAVADANAQDLAIFGVGHLGRVAATVQGRMSLNATPRPE